MDEQLKQRLVGAAVLVLLAVIFIPMILDRPGEPEVTIEHPQLPSKSEAEFNSRVVPLSEPETPLVDAERKRQAVSESKPAEPPAPVATARQAPARTVTKEKAVASPPSETAKAPPAGASAAWAIQLGSFSSAKNAMALRDSLKKKGYVAFIETARVGDKEITRVFVGPELARERAEELVKKLQADTELKGMVVQYPGS